MTFLKDMGVPNFTGKGHMIKPQFLIFYSSLGTCLGEKQNDHMLILGPATT